jgi:hypothetical protein
MIIDLPPSSAFAPDPAVARSRGMPQSHTLTLPLGHGLRHSSHKPMSGSVRVNHALCSDGETLRVSAVPTDKVVLTITF